MPAPIGNNNAGRGREATRSLEKALARHSGIEDKEFIARFEALVKIWEKQIEKALEGDAKASEMITDRLEGRPAQSFDVGGQSDNPIEITEVIRTIVRPKDTDS